MQGARPWLNLLPDEVEPTILDSEKPVLDLWFSLWPNRPNDNVHLSLTAAGSETLLRFTLLTPDDPPDASKTGHLRRRVNHLLSLISATPADNETPGNVRNCRGAASIAHAAGSASWELVFGDGVWAL